MTDTNVVDVPIGDTTYQLRRRLGWQKAQEIQDAAIRITVDGKMIQAMKSVEDLGEVDLRLDNVKMNKLRLEARLLNHTRQAIAGLPDAHVVLLIEAIEQLEKDQAAEVDALRPKSEVSETGTTTEA